MGRLHNYVANQGVGRWPEAGVLKKLSLAGLAKLSRLRCTCNLLSLVWPQPAIMDSETTVGRCTKQANSQLRQEFLRN
jgi:hypothetical protein